MFFFKQKTAYEMRISDWSSDVCSSDLTTLLRTIVGQQVSVAAANSIWNKLEAQFGEGCPTEVIAAADFDTLRACGLSGQKQGYAKSLAQLILDGELTFDALPADDEDRKSTRLNSSH